MSFVYNSKTRQRKEEGKDTAKEKPKEMLLRVRNVFMFPFLFVSELAQPHVTPFAATAIW
jgi:hypothetical protein